MMIYTDYLEFIGIMVVYGDFVHDQNLGVPFLWRIDRHCICFSGNGWINQ